MPASCNTDIFSQSLDNHSWLRRFYHYFSDNLLLKNKILKREIAICSKRKTKVQHVFYPGFGIGQLLTLFYNNQKYNVFAIDCNQSFVSKSTNFLQSESVKNIYCKTENVTTYVKPESFDLSLCVNLLNYIENDVEVLQNFYTNLKSPGVLVLFNSSNYADQRDTKLSTGIYKDNTYRLGYSLVEIKSKLKQAGFAKVKARYVYGFPGVLSWKLTTGWPSYVIKKSSLFFAFLPFYVVLAIVPVIVLNLLDIGFPHTKGKCIVVKAFK
jgi:SAM-dependent methyltransferase